MNEYSRVVLFDLDGTLIDSHEAIYESAVTILSHYTEELPSKEKVFKSVGLPISGLFSEFILDSQLNVAVKDFRSHLKAFGHEKTNLIPDARNTLEHFKEHGIAIGLVSNKQTALAVSVLEQQEISGYFDLVVGSDLGAAKPSPDLISFALSKFPKPVFSVMVGDRVEDMEAAKSAGISGIFLENTWNPMEDLIRLLPYKPKVICSLRELFRAYLEIEEVVSVD